MIREIVKIDRELCNGCELCIPNCHEGALQMIDGKATLVSELMCDGLGACLGHCPVGAITIEKREAQDYNEIEVMKRVTKEGKNVVVAHLRHLDEHNEVAYLRQGIEFLQQNEGAFSFSTREVIKAMAEINDETHQHEHQHTACGCPGSQEKTIEPKHKVAQLHIQEEAKVESELSQWPIQMHLINPAASYFKGADILLAADCSAFAYGNFHQKFLKGKKMIMACPKLDHGQDIYMQKLIHLIQHSQIRSLQVIMMEVPCCFGLSKMVDAALAHATNKIPVTRTIISISGEILQETIQ